MRVNCKTSDFKPVGRKIVVEMDKVDRIGSIILPKEQKTTTGTVKCVGPNVIDIKGGDKVILGQFKGTEYEFDDGVNTMCFEEHVLAVYE